MISKLNKRTMIWFGQIKAVIYFGLVIETAQTNCGILLRGRWLVVATGENAERVVPEFEGLEEFGGGVVHACDYKSGETYNGQRVLVVGCGNSGMEVSLDLCNHHASPSMVVRSSVSPQNPTIVLLILPHFSFLTLQKIVLMLFNFCTTKVDIFNLKSEPDLSYFVLFGSSSSGSRVTKRSVGKVDIRSGSDADEEAASVDGGQDPAESGSCDSGKRREVWSEEARGGAIGAEALCREDPCVGHWSSEEDQIWRN